MGMKAKFKYILRSISPEKLPDIPRIDQNDQNDQNINIKEEINIDMKNNENSLNAKKSRKKVESGQNDVDFHLEHEKTKLSVSQASIRSASLPVKQAI